MALTRLNKIIADAGIASRRAADQLILDGRVSVDGETVIELGGKYDPEIHDIKVDGESGAVLYQTTSFFLEKLGLNSIADLPALAPFLPDIDGLDELLSTLTD